MKRWKGSFVGWALCAGLLSISFYSLHGDNDVPDNALESVKLLKKPIEELLPDLQDAEPNTPEAVQQATLELEPYSDLHNERDRWNEMRSLIESGQPLETPLPSEIAISTSPVGHLAPAIPPPPGFTVQLPYESRLTVSGRKTIGLDFKSTSYSNSTYATTQGLPTSQSSFELQQQLQVRINGQIGRKVTVNVDFDDTKQDKKDISIVYKGDPDEVVQRAAFGDINLTLPQTEFAGYSKQVFGASAELKYKALHGYFIGSRTKGTTETKEFVGNVILQRLDVPDTSYIRHRFYNFKAMTHGATTDDNVDISKMRVFLDTQDSARSTVGRVSFSVDLTAIPSFPGGVTPPTYPGSFVELHPGTDYTVDNVTGFITFRNVLTNNSVVAVEYPLPGTGQLNTDSGTHGNNPGLRKAIKWDETTITQIPSTEDLTHYNLGTSQIVRDDGQGNFLLQVLDLGRNNIGPNLQIQYLPNNAGQIVVDFVQGIFYLTTRLDKNNPASQYAQVYQPTPTHQATFSIEFRSRVKTYTLRPNIVLNSEQITLNGRKLTRDVDYFIDYESGFITFFNPDQITETSRIVASYDFSPFGIAGAQQDTLVGGRTELSLYPVAPILGQSSIGTTLLYDFAPQQTSAPDIRQTAGSFLVTEGDMHLKDLIFNPIPMLKTSFTGEVAHSKRNVNNFGLALVDNMEGIVDDTSVGMTKLNWQISSNPDLAQQTFANAIGVYHLDNEAGDNLQNELIPTLDINPDASALPGDQMQVLDVNYNLINSTEASITTVISPTGVDFSKKLFLQMWVFGDGTRPAGSASGTTMNVTLGQVSEDFDHTGVLKTEDGNSNNTLDINEDVGIQFRNPDGSFTTLGANNARIDSNDLNRNGRLDTLDSSNGNGIGGEIGFHSPGTSDQHLAFPGGSPADTVDFAGWRYVQVPLDISSSTAANWSAIQEIRITLKQGVPRQGVIKIAKISVVGNKYLANDLSPIGSSVTASAVNNEVDKNYSSPAFSDFNTLNQINTALSGPQPAKRKEQSLQLDYTLLAPTVSTPIVDGSVTSITNSPMDFTPYGSIRFFLRKSPTATSVTDNGTFFFRAGTDTDYWEFDIPVSQINREMADWTEIRINQTRIGKSQEASGWATGFAGGTVHSRGSPNLSSVSQLQFGVEVSTNDTSTAHDVLWIDELHVGDAIERSGNAARGAGDFEVFGWGKLSLGMRDIDQNFQTFTSAITNQARHEETADLDLNHLSWFPMKFAGIRRRTDTPNVNQVNNNTLVSINQQGRVDERGLSGTGTLQLPRIPKFGLLWDTDKIDTAALFRSDKTDHYGITMDYSLPSSHVILPKSVQLGYKRTNLGITFDPSGVYNTQFTDPFSISNTKDKTDDYTAKLSFQPLPGFTFNPILNRTETSESKAVIYSTNPVDGVVASTQTLNYQKLRSQEMGIDGVMNFTRWFAPRVRYDVKNLETFGIPLVSSPTASAQKNVDRSATGELAWDFAWRDFSKKVQSLQSLNVVSSYLIEDGDSYSSVSSGKNSLWSLWLRNGLKDSTGARQNQTLRDTIRSTQRWSPFDWAHNWGGSATPLRTLSMTSTITDTKQKTEVTGTPSNVITHIYPDLILSLTQTEYFFRAENFMSNSQMNIKTQWKTVSTIDTSYEKAKTNGGDWRFTLWKKLDFFFTYTRTDDKTDDLVNNVTSSDAFTDSLGTQLGFNIGKWRISPKYDQTRQQATDSSGRLTTDQTTRTPAVQFYADLFLPAGLRLPFGDLVVFSNRIRTTSTVSLTQKRSSLSALQSNTDTYTLATSEDYELTSNMRLTVGGSYSFTQDKTTSSANFYSYEFNSLLTIQF